MRRDSGTVEITCMSGRDRCISVMMRFHLPDEMVEDLFLSTGIAHLLLVIEIN